MGILTHIAVATRDRKRLQEIGSVLARFGIEDALRRLGLSSFLPLVAGAGVAREVAATPLPERVRMAMEALGPTFVKLGQILVTRGDLLGAEWVAAFETLHSNAVAAPPEVMEAALTEALGAPAAELFAHFDPVPVAAGSIAQVYRARLKDGSEVVVKLQRPGIDAIIDADLRILLHLAQLAQDHAPELARYRITDMVRYLGAALRDELDFAREGRNTEQIAANFEGQEAVVIPRIHWEHTGRTVLVQDYLDGIAPSDSAALRAAGLDPATLAQRGTDAVLQMAFVDGVFHGDPHPGNILCLPGNRVGFIDFGMVGRVSRRRRDELLTFIDAIMNEQGGRVRDVLLAWANAGEVDLRQLEDDADAYVARHRSPPLDFARAITDFMAMARTHRLVLPADLVILFKALVTSEAVARRLDPEIDIIARAAPVAREVLFESFSPVMLKGMALTLLGEGRSLTAELPGALRGLMRSMQRGRIALDMDIRGLENASRGIERAAMRLAIAIITAAFAMTLGPRLMAMEAAMFGQPVFTVLGLAVTGIGILWLALASRK